MPTPRPYLKRAIELLEEAKRRNKPFTSEDPKDTRDNKLYIESEDLTALIGVGARIINFNEKQAGGGYIHNVDYKDYFFVSASSQPLVLEISGSLTSILRGDSQ